MGKGTKKDALANSGVASGWANTDASRAGAMYGPLSAELTTEAAHPAGYDPTTLAKMKTAAMQTAGGANAGAVGQGALYASRTKNAGAGDAAIGQSGRTASETLSKDNLATDLSNAQLKEHQRQAGLTGMEGLYNTDLGASMNALNLSNNAISVAGQQKPSFWQEMATTAGKNLVNAATDAAEAGMGF